MSINCEFVYTKDLEKISLSGDKIYYLYTYYKKAWIDKYPDNHKMKDNFFSFIALKKGTYSTYKNSLKFVAAIRNFLKKLEGDWIICTAPGHEKTNNESNAVCDLIKQIDLESNLSLKNSLIQRSHTVEKKSSNNDRVMNPDIDIKSLALDQKINVNGKNIIVIDDITTTGCTLVACRNLLKKHGAKNVVCMALGKTKEFDYYYGY